MTLTGDAASAAADAAQAAYFRASLDAERQQLLDEMLERRPLIDRRPGTRPLSTAAHRAAAEVRYLDGLIQRLDRRFGSHWRVGD